MLLQETEEWTLAGDGFHWGEEKKREEKGVGATTDRAGKRRPEQLWSIFRGPENGRIKATSMKISSENHPPPNA